MKYAILSDIHSNFKALSSIIEDGKKEHIDQYICAGDIVGYGASPLECIDLIRELKFLSVIGNHDLSSCGSRDLERLNPNARVAAEWTYRQLDTESKEYLRSLPFLIEREGFVVSHGSLYQPEAFFYIQGINHARLNFGYQSKPLCFVGHTHVPVIFREASSKVALMRSSKIIVKVGEKYLFNVGSVGQPRDLDHRAAYVIYDDQKQVLSIKRVDYEVEKAAEKIVKAGLPKFLAYRLLIGK